MKKDGGTTELRWPLEVETSKNNIKGKGHRQRVKNKILKNGMLGMLDYEVLEAFLFYAVPQKDTKELAKKILLRFKTIENALHAPKEELLSIKGVGESIYSYFKIMKEFNGYLYKNKVENGVLLNSVESTYKYLKNSIGYSRKEVFKLLYLSSSNELLGEEDLFLGTLDKSAIYPREIIKEVLRYNAKSVIFSHNHPSGSLKPSEADIKITRKLKEILSSLEVGVLDHIIISPRGYLSFLEEGLM